MILLISSVLGFTTNDLNFDTYHYQGTTYLKYPPAANYFLWYISDPANSAETAFLVQKAKLSQVKIAVDLPLQTDVTPIDLPTEIALNSKILTLAPNKIYKSCLTVNPKLINSATSFTKQNSQCGFFHTFSDHKEISSFLGKAVVNSAIKTSLDYNIKLYSYIEGSSSTGSARICGIIEPATPSAQWGFLSFVQMQKSTPQDVITYDSKAEKIIDSFSYSLQKMNNVFSDQTLTKKTRFCKDNVKKLYTLKADSVLLFQFERFISNYQDRKCDAELINQKTKICILGVETKGHALSPESLQKAADFKACGNFLSGYVLSAVLLGLSALML